MSPGGGTFVRPSHRVADFRVGVERVGATHVVEVGGSLSPLGAALLGTRLLALLDDGARQVVLDLGVARAPAPGAMLATLLRVDRYGAHRGAQVVIVAGPATRSALDTNSARRLLAVAGSRRKAIERFEREPAM